jgi:hypothetical protein
MVFDDDSHGTIRNLTDGIKSVYTATQTMMSIAIVSRRLLA